MICSDTSSFPLLLARILRFVLLKIVLNWFFSHPCILNVLEHIHRPGIFDVFRQLAPLFHHSLWEEVSSYVQPCSLSLSSIRFSCFCTSLSQQCPSPATGSQRPPKISTLGARKSWKKEPMMLLSRNKKILYQTQPWLAFFIAILHCRAGLRELSTQTPRSFSSSVLWA